jgi:hypothetical protein
MFIKYVCSDFEKRRDVDIPVVVNLIPAMTSYAEEGRQGPITGKK